VKLQRGARNVFCLRRRHEVTQMPQFHRVVQYARWLC
jgi:hypothetical protein